MQGFSLFWRYYGVNAVNRFGDKTALREKPNVRADLLA